MKVILAVIICLCAVIPLSVQAQEQSDPVSRGIGDPRKFDEYGNISFSDEKARLDNLAFHLRDEPNYVAYLWVYAGRKSCLGEARARATRAKNYLVNKRGIKADRVIWKEAGHREEFTVEIWAWPRSVGEPSEAPTVDPNEARVINCKARSIRRGRGKSQAAPNNGMHPTANQRPSYR